MTITPEQLQQAIQAAVAAAAQQSQEAAALMQQEIGTLRTQVQTTQAAPPHHTDADTRLLGKPESFDGGTGWKDWRIVFRSLSVLFCTVGIALGTGGEIGQPRAQRNPYSSRGLVFHTALLHAGHAVQGDSPHASGERWRAGGHGSLESSSLASRIDLVDAKRKSVARAPELQLRRRDRDTRCSSTATSTATRKEAARTSRTTSLPSTALD